MVSGFLSHTHTHTHTPIRMHLNLSSLITDQDENLDHLSLAIGRQRELGLLIGDELDSHVQLIDETEMLTDRTDERLRRAKRKLDYVGRKVKDNSK